MRGSGPTATGRTGRCRADTRWWLTQLCLFAIIHLSSTGDQGQQGQSRQKRNSLTMPPHCVKPLPINLPFSSFPALIKAYLPFLPPCPAPANPFIPRSPLLIPLRPLSKRQNPASCPADRSLLSPVQENTAPVNLLPWLASPYCHRPTCSCTAFSYSLQILPLKVEIRLNFLIASWSQKNNSIVFLL